MMEVRERDEREEIGKGKGKRRGFVSWRGRLREGRRGRHTCKSSWCRLTKGSSGNMYFSRTLEVLASFWITLATWDQQKVTIGGGGMAGECCSNGQYSCSPHVQWTISNTDTLGPIKCVLIREVSSFQGANIQLYMRLRFGQVSW